MASAQTKLPVPPGGDPALACGQKPDGRAYWTEYAYCDVAVRGPHKATGLILWSHGVSGTNEQYRAPPNSYVRRLVSAGWDVIKINRNNLYEHGWTTSGGKHVDDLIARTQKARADGYARVIAGGQSYGGVISLEANAKMPGLFYAILANSPGHGSDAPTGGSGSTNGGYYNLDRYLLETLARQHDSRIVLSLPPNDALHPNRDGSPIESKVRDALTADGLPYVYFDHSMPINGHGAAATNQFNVWFGGCIQTFLDPAKTTHGAETRCPPPSPVPQFLLPADLKIPASESTGLDRWLGAWVGAFEDRRDLAIVVEKISGNVGSVVYVVGSGPKKDLSAGWNRYTKARVDGDTIKIDRGSDRTIVLSLSQDGRQLEISHYFKDGKLVGTLTRPAGGRL